MESITIKRTIKKTLKLPKIKEKLDYNLSDMCLVRQPSQLNCKGISCTQCIFYGENYKEFINSEEGE